MTTFPRPSWETMRERAWKWGKHCGAPMSSLALSRLNSQKLEVCYIVCWNKRQNQGAFCPIHIRVSGRRLSCRMTLLYHRWPHQEKNKSKTKNRGVACLHGGIAQSLLSVSNNMNCIKVNDASYQVWENSEVVLIEANWSLNWGLQGDFLGKD